MVCNGPALWIYVPHFRTRLAMETHGRILQPCSMTSFHVSVGWPSSSSSWMNSWEATEKGTHWCSSNGSACLGAGQASVVWRAAGAIKRRFTAQSHACLYLDVSRPCDIGMGEDLKVRKSWEKETPWKSSTEFTTCCKNFVHLKRENCESQGEWDREVTKKEEHF